MFRWLGFLFGDNDKRPASDDPTSIGNVLLLAGMASAEDMNAVLSAQQKTARSKLGDLLVRAGVIDEAQLAEALYLQRKARGTARRRDAMKHELARQLRRRAALLTGANDLQADAALLCAKLKE